MQLVKIFNCLFREHSWGPWSWQNDREGDRGCYERRECSRCAKEERLGEKLDHDLSPPVLDGCFARTHCKRCSYSTWERSHDWTGWLPIGNPCYLQRSCCRCGTQEHQLTHEWISSDGDPCGMERCNVCGQERKLGHDMAEVGPRFGSSGTQNIKYTTFQCLRCGHIEDGQVEVG